MKKLFQAHKYRIVFIVLFLVVATASLVISEYSAKQLKASLLTLPEAGFTFWYIENTEDAKSLEIPDIIGSMVTLPFGITSTAPEQTAELDSVEFHLNGLPDYLRFDGADTFPGFHIDSHVTEGTSLETYDLAIYITPEEFEEENWEPGAPNISSIGNLIEATAEVLRLNFEIVSTPVDDLPPVSINAIVTERNGDFTRHVADGNSLLGGNNPGTLELTVLSTNFPQTEAVYPVGTDSLVLDFNTPVLSGSATPGAYNTDNYFVYKCGNHLPTPDPRDPLYEDSESCRQQIQDSIAEPGTPLSAVIDVADPSKVTLAIDDERLFVDGAQYIVLIRNIGDETGEYFIPEAGIYSQPFTWKAYPTVLGAVPLDVDVLHVIFNEPVCAANSEFGATNNENYRILPCNFDTSIDECLDINLESANEIEVTDALYDGNRTVSLQTGIQQENTYYVVRVKNIRNGNCEEDSAIPLEPAQYSPQFSGFNSTPQAGELSLVPSKSGVIHLPWREIFEFSPAGGMPPYTIDVIPEEAGTIEYNPSSGEAVFTPRLTDGNNQAIHDDRDVIIRVTDYEGIESELKIHILRRGDLGGRDSRLIDKTDVMDVNDVSAGWKR